MIRAIVFVLTASLVASGASWLVDLPFEVAVFGRGFELRTSLAVAVAAILLLALLLLLLFELYRALATAPRRFARYRQQRRLARGYRSLGEGLLAAAAGNAEEARALAREARRTLGEAPTVLLLEAQAAQLAGDERAAAQGFERLLAFPESELVGLKGLLSQAMRSGEHERALELARRAYRRAPEASWAASALFELLTGARRWTEALAVVDRLAPLGLATVDEGARYRGILHHLRALDLAAETRWMDALKEERKALRAAPGFVPAAITAARIAHRLGREREARRVLEEAWAVAPHPELARTYADLVPQERPADRLKRFERLRARNPEHLETRLALAELALLAGRLDAARTLLQAAAQGDATARAYRLMAELERAAGASASVVQSWLAKAGEAPPDPAWVCEDTGEILPEWRPFSTSGRFGAVLWRVPPKVSALALAPRPPFLLVDSRPEASEASARPEAAEAAA
ncbi:MAG: tetratricopeptide repeat protein [Geminicoccaceae bacterium]|nr:tetratricopeptide repeat protein [Geminicoccaceae bacterium]MCS7268087.1 tetratricopeptide repeat protein [Geminicoccaceae bacterium]MCX7629632.1 tetratricopeptide repeat protein [Geminicoccaceae bacterium]MDW8125477.1 heme biosynthesis HemY N-terminal domain-containing protein [Geminicoccaceae bacterium]MDW8342327.1 heme biosynthesis HemY N-terminal domain-containing protein [Geminicoccaceae bacterium]